MIQRILKEKVHFISGSIFLIVMLVIFGIKGIGIYPDTVTYVEMNTVREPFYTTLLAVLRFIFSENVYFYVLVIGQIIFAVISSCYFAKTVEDCFKLRWIWTAFIYCIMLGMYLLPAVFSLSGIVTFLAVLTEGICFPIFFLFVRSAILVVCNNDSKQLKWVVIYAVIMTMTRSQLMPMLVVAFFVSCYWIYSNSNEMKKWIKLIVGFILLFVCIGIVEGCYFKVVSGHFMRHTGGNVTTMANILYLAEEEDADLFEDEEIRKVFVDTYNYMQKEGWGISDYEGRGIIDAAVDVENCHDLIKGRAFLDAMDYYYEKNPLGKDEYKSVHNDYVAGEIYKTLLPKHFGRWFYDYIGLCLVGFIRTVAVFPQSLFMQIYTVIIYLLFLAGVIYYRKNKKILMYGLLTFLVIICNVCAMSLVIMCISRYTLYGMPLIYGGFVIMISEFIKEKLAKKDRRK